MKRLAIKTIVLVMPSRRFLAIGGVKHGNSGFSSTGWPPASRQPVCPSHPLSFRRRSDRLRQRPSRKRSPGFGNPGFGSPMYLPRIDQRTTTLSSAAKTSSMVDWLSEKRLGPRVAIARAPSNPRGQLGKLGEWKAKLGEHTSSIALVLPFLSAENNLSRIALLSSAHIVFFRFMSCSPSKFLPVYLTRNFLFRSRFKLAPTLGGLQMRRSNSLRIFEAAFFH